MPVLLFKGFAHTPAYIGPSGRWVKGDQREVEKAEADRLLADFPQCFEAVGSAVAAPKKSRAVKSPTKRRAASKPKADK